MKAFSGTRDSFNRTHVRISWIGGFIRLRSSVRTIHLLNAMIEALPVMLHEYNTDGGDGDQVVLKVFFHFSYSTMLSLLLSRIMQVIWNTVLRHPHHHLTTLTLLPPQTFAMLSRYEGLISQHSVSSSFIPAVVVVHASGTAKDSNNKVSLMKQNGLWMLERGVKPIEGEGTKKRRDNTTTCKNVDAKYSHGSLLDV